MEIHFFWSGPLSNWQPSPFAGALWDGVARQFANNEQFMMAGKAQFFGDSAALEKILATSDPKQAKAIGREVRGFRKEAWDAEARNIVYVGCSYKFEQNPECRECLQAATGVIAEASPYDTIWGIGLRATDPRAKDPAQWRGTNWLGQVLMQIRKDLATPTALDQKRKAILDAIREGKRLPDLFRQSL